MDGDEREGWAGFGASLLDGLCTGSLSILPAARQKLFQSVIHTLNIGLYLSLLDCCADDVFVSSAMDKSY